MHFNTTPLLLAAVLISSGSVFAAEFHVAPGGDDANDGSAVKPFKTISTAALKAMPGDMVTVHAGTYRERVDPPRGGTSENDRIVYQAAPGEKVVITGSELAMGWVKVGNDTWKLALPNSRFGDFNPYADLIRGDWFQNGGRAHHTGCVYLNGEWLIEAANLDQVMQPAAAGQTPLWFAKVAGDDGNFLMNVSGLTEIFAQFPDVDPNKESVEINQRQVVFYPSKAGINYITVRGFILENAATNWAPPTAEQKAIIGPHWAKGWIIENNTVRHSKCAGISLGKYGDEWDNRSESAEAYVAAIHRALANGWSKETVGSHIVRNNHIHDCEQAGIVGGMGCAFSIIEGNEIHDIHVRRLFSGLEQSCIKFHGAVDVIIRNNHLYRGENGVWLDWMAQGAQVTGNLIHDCRFMLINMEVNHGPCLIANNLLLSDAPIQLCGSDGTAFVHNLNLWKMWPNAKVDERQTPFLKAHSTAFAGLHNTPHGDDRVYNNIFAANTDLRIYDDALLPSELAGNVFLKGTTPAKAEKDPLVLPEIDPGIKLAQKPDGWYLTIRLDPAWRGAHQRPLVTSEMLGKAVIPGVPFENPDGTPFKIDTDYFGAKRDPNSPFPGPFEITKDGPQEFKVWPK